MNMKHKAASLVILCFVSGFGLHAGKRKDLRKHLRNLIQISDTRVVALESYVKTLQGAQAKGIHIKYNDLFLNAFDSVADTFEKRLLIFWNGPVPLDDRSGYFSELLDYSFEIDKLSNIHESSMVEHYKNLTDIFYLLCRGYQQLSEDIKSGDAFHLHFVTGNILGRQAKINHYLYTVPGLQRLFGQPHVIEQYAHLLAGSSRRAPRTPPKPTPSVDPTRPIPSTPADVAWENLYLAQRAKTEYYDILGISSGASEDEIKKAYRKLSVRFHPDKNRAHPEDAAELFKLISEAYDILIDAEIRKVYDEFGKDAALDASRFSHAE